MIIKICDYCLEEIAPFEMITSVFSSNDRLTRPAEFHYHQDCLKEILPVLMKRGKPGINEPVRHAYITKERTCSACGYDIPTDDGAAAILPNEVLFCYHCGATMDEVSE